MDKTLLKKLTEKHLATYTPPLMGSDNVDMHINTLVWPVVGLSHEMNLLKAAAKDLLQPRPEAVARLLQLAKDL